MKIAYPTGTRMDILDRNPIPIALQFIVGGAVPHAKTERISYTVPANKRFMLEFISWQMRLTTVQTLVGNREMECEVNLGGGDIDYCHTHTTLNTLESGLVSTIFAQSLFVAGNTIKISSTDGGTNSVNMITCSIFGTEYDA